MSIFDPVRTREIFLHSILDFERRSRREDYRPNAVGNAAVAGLSTVVYAWLVGLEDEVGPLLHKYRDWLEDSIRSQERFGDPPAYFAMVREQTYALCLWMMDGERHQAVYARALTLAEEAWAELVDAQGVSPGELRDEYLEDYLCICLQAEEYARGVTAYEKLGGVPIIEVTSVLSPAEFGYWGCGQRISTAWSADDFVCTGAHMIESRLEDDWLGSGQALRAAHWLKAVLGDTGKALTPLATIRKAYDLMPNVPKPEFIGKS